MEAHASIEVHADDPVMGPIPSDFPVESLTHEAVETFGRGYAMIPNNQVADSSEWPGLACPGALDDAVPEPHPAVQVDVG